MFCLCSDIRHDYIYCGGGGGCFVLSHQGHRAACVTRLFCGTVCALQEESARGPADRPGPLPHGGAALLQCCTLLKIGRRILSRV